MPCDLPHDYEVFHGFDLAEGEYPGAWSIRNLAIEGCLSAFEALVGRDYELSELDVTYLYPSAESWREGDLAVVCIAFDTSRADLTGPVIGSDR